MSLKKSDTPNIFLTIVVITGTIYQHLARVFPTKNPILKLRY
ncbi:protein of unassigned function [Methylobacterium oryzae CBMB20]|uniref:Protein of unassigned function n=1 Tax=Methylobacterium oryzae CBMB20 TaxID=693986 RepID=A0A089Q9U6_9HYPH|nr:protein of unassigned function [Methylobacterium oryzae CBMB20]